MWTGGPLMSSASINRLGSLAGTVTAQSLLALLVTSVKRIAFWTAIALPFLHVSLLTTGLDSPETQIAFVALVALNVGALLLGHPHNR
jgi:hypothetical protein